MLLTLREVTQVPGWTWTSRPSTLACLDCKCGLCGNEFIYSVFICKLSSFACRACSLQNTEACLTAPATLGLWNCGQADRIASLGQELSVWPWKDFAGAASHCVATPPGNDYRALGQGRCLHGTPLHLSTSMAPWLFFHLLSSSPMPFPAHIPRSGSHCPLCALGECWAAPGNAHSTAFPSSAFHSWVSARSRSPGRHIWERELGASGQRGPRLGHSSSTASLSV